MALTEENKRGISSNIQTAMMATLQCLEWCEKKKSPEAALTRQTAVQTIVLIAIAQMLLETVEVSKIIQPS